MGNQPGKLQQQNQSSRPKKNVHWKSAERPSPPGRPSLIPLSDQQPDVVNLRWDRPKMDGGSPITGYVVEHRRMGSPHWVRATPTPVPRCEASLSGLEPGWRYQFRVFAENVVGRSDPSELSDALTVTLQRNAITVPRFIDELEEKHAVEDERLEFRVRVVGQPPPEINWFKDGYEIFSSRRTRIVNDGETSSLIIHQVALTDEGEIKCTATNRAGHVVTKTKLLVQAPPRIRLPRTYEDGLIVEADEVLRLKVGIAGQPPPSVTWLHEGEIIISDGRYEIINTEKNSMFKIDSVERSDRGEYSVKAWNKLGEDATSFLLTVTARPDPPGKVRLNMSFGKSATLSWTAPLDDGGCKIGNYIVEYFRVGWNVWLKAATTRSLSTTLNDLIEGSEYKFRVKAENPYGLSEPSEESDVLFIPDPKRGIVKPKSESKISEDNNKPLPPRRKTLSPSRPHQDAATETRSSPMLQRKPKPHLLDSEDLHREMSYGTPDQVLKMDVRRSPSYTGTDVTTLDTNQAIISLMKSVASSQRERTSTFLENSKQVGPHQPSSPLLQKTRQKSPQTENDNNHYKGTPSPSETRRRTPLRISPTPPETESIKATRALQRSAEPVQLGGNQNVLRFTRNALSPARNVPSLAIAIATSSMGTNRSNSPDKRDVLSLSNPKIQISAPPPPQQQAKSQPQHQPASLPSLILSSSPVQSTTPLTTPEKLTPLNTSDRHDDVHTSNEFMLVVFDKNSKVKDKDKQDSFELDLEDSLQPPPVSISAPDLASLEFTNLHTTFPLRRSVSSTELLYERAMARFYEAVEYEEAEKARKAQVQQEKLTTPLGAQSSFIRKRLGSMTEAERLSFERRSEKRRLSADFAQEFKTGPTKWSSRDNISQINAFARTKTNFLQKESFETQESDEMSDDFAERNAPLKTDSYEIGSDYTESTAPSEEDSIEKFKMELMARTGSLSPRELETYHPRDMSSGIFTPYRAPTPDEAALVLNRPMPLASPDFVPKPILKRPPKESAPLCEESANINVNSTLMENMPVNRPPEKSMEKKKGIKSFFKRDKRAVTTENKAPAEDAKINKDSPDLDDSYGDAQATTGTTNVSNKNMSMTESEKIENAKTRRPSKQEEELRLKEAERISQEEAHVAADHYSELVRQVSTTRKYRTPLYLNPEASVGYVERGIDDNVDIDEEYQRRKKSLTPEINFIPPQSNKPRLSISERSQLVHVRDTPSDLAFIGEEKPTIEPETPSEDNTAPQFPLETLQTPTPTPTSTSTTLPPQNQRQLSPGLPEPFSELRQDIIEPAAETEESMTTTTIISETTEERPDSRGRSRIVKVRRIVKKRIPSKSRDISTNRTVLASMPGTSQKSDGVRNESNPPIRRRVLSRTRAASRESRPTRSLPQNQDPTTLALRNEILEPKSPEQLSEDTQEKVRSALSYSTDLVLFVVACYVYLFKDARLVLPILALMIYRQLGEAVAAYIPNWMKRKRN